MVVGKMMPENSENENLGIIEVHEGKMAGLNFRKERFISAQRDLHLKNYNADLNSEGIKTLSINYVKTKFNLMLSDFLKTHVYVRARSSIAVEVILTVNSPVLGGDEMCLVLDSGILDNERNVILKGCISGQSKTNMISIIVTAPEESFENSCDTTGSVSVDLVWFRETNYLDRVNLLEKWMLYPVASI